ncbi:SGNH/GDSL hydrolase family protein [Acinetobacter geminorum]|uniref:SGNH/GDSL hydrolase family protein n=1 Tax=Acinetobacter geminorum TaxID=2730922 RepID=UPI001478E080|nr:SGNH/GDSL hydrolase family protein [Acinetobacter geminorum]
MSDLQTKVDNAIVDMGTVEQFTSSDEFTDIISRLGRVYPSLAKAIRTLMENGAYEPFATEAQLLASTPLLPKRAAKALDTKKIWIWEVRAPLTTPAWYDTGESELDIAKRYAENAAVAAPKGIKQFGYYTGTSTTTLISQDGPQAYAVQVNESGFIKKFRTQLAGGPAKVRVQVYRPSDKGATLIETRLYDVSYPQSEVSLIDNPIRVEKNDLVTLAWVSGIFIRGKIVSSGDPLGSLVITQTLTIGQQVAISRSRNSLEFQIDVLTDSQLATVQNIDPMTRLAVGYGVVESISTFKQGVLNTPNTTGSFSFAYGNIDALTKFGKLSQIKYTTRSISKDVLFRLCILAPNADGTHKVTTVKQVLAPSDANGVVTATSKHFGDIFVPKGGYALIAGTTEIDAPLAQVGIAGGFSYIASTDIQLNANVTVSKNSNNQPISAEFTYESSSLNLEDRVVALENNELHATPPVYSTVLDSQIFSGSTIPERWTAPNWTIDDTGLQSPATGGWNVNALSTGFSALANREYRQEFIVADINSVFGFCTAPIETNSGAAVALVDGSNKKLHIMLWDGSATAGTPVASVDMQPLVANTPYILSVEKRGYFSTVKLINKVTGQTNTVEYSGTNPYVQFHGRAGFTFISGSVKFKNYRFTAFYPREVHFVIEGDSNSERAATVLPNKTWAFMLADMRRMNADAIVGGRSGDETPNFLKRKEYDLMAWRPKYVIWALGTNDTSQATWRTNMQQNIADTLAIGAEPILVTQIPRNDSQALRTAMNDDIRNGYFGPYRYIEFAKAVSLNNDGVTWDPIYDSGDHIHVNPAGQQRLLQQVLIDMPELIR